MWQDKENFNTGQCFTPKKSLRDIFASVSTSKNVSPQKKSPTGRRVDPSRVLTPVNLNILPSNTNNINPIKYDNNADSLNDSFFSSSKMDLDTTFENIPVTPGRSSLARYSFSFFHLQPELAPPTTPRADNNTINHATNIPQQNNKNLDLTITNISKISDQASDVDSSDISDNCSDISDHSDLPIPSRPTLPSPSSYANAFSAVPSFSSFSSSTSLREPINKNLPKPEVKFATPTKMRVPKPKTSAWAHSPFHKTPSKHVSMQSTYEDQEKKKTQASNGGIILNLGGKFDEIMSQNDDLSSQPLSSLPSHVEPVKSQLPKPSMPAPSFSSSSIPQPISFQLPNETKQALMNFESSLNHSSKPLPSFPLAYESNASSSSASFILPPKTLQSFPLEEEREEQEEKEEKEEKEEPVFQVPSHPAPKTSIPSISTISYSDTKLSNTRKSVSASSIPKPTTEKGKTENPRKAFTKSKSSVDMDLSFQLPSKKPKLSVDPLNTSLQIPTKKTSIASSSSVGKPTKSTNQEKTGIRRPSTIPSSSSNITPKNNITDNSRLKAATAPRPSLPALSSTTPKKRSANEMDTSFSSISSSLSSTTPKRKPRPSEIINNSLTTPTSTILSSSSSSTSLSSSKSTLPKTTPKKYAHVSGSGYGSAKSASSIPSSSSYSSSSSSSSSYEAPSRIPVSKKSKVETVSRSAEEEFELKLEMALQAGSVGGNNSLPRTPTAGNRPQEQTGNKWSPIRKRALTFEESVLACTKKTKNDL